MLSAPTCLNSILGSMSGLLVLRTFQANEESRLFYEQFSEGDGLWFVAIKHVVGGCPNLLFVGSRLMRGPFFLFSPVFGCLRVWVSEDLVHGV